MLEVSSLVSVVVKAGGAAQETCYFDSEGMVPFPVGVPFLSQSRVKRATREPLFVSAWR